MASANNLGILGKRPKGRGRPKCKKVQKLKSAFCFSISNFLENIFPLKTDISPGFLIQLRSNKSCQNPQKVNFQTTQFRRIWSFIWEIQAKRCNQCRLKQFLQHPRNAPFDLSLHYITQNSFHALKADIKRFSKSQIAAY